MTKTVDMRSFKGGAWDLRKDDRRKGQREIAFPDRRKVDRRSGQWDGSDTSTSVGLLNWVNRIDEDE